MGKMQSEKETPMEYKREKVARISLYHVLVNSVNVGSYTLLVKAFPYMNKDHLTYAQEKETFYIDKLIIHLECV